MFEHLIISGVNKEYKIWVHHGEIVPESEEDIDTDMEDQPSIGLHEMVNDFWNAATVNNETEDGTTPDRQEDVVSNKTTNEEASKFHGLVEDAEQELYPGCNAFSTLSFVVQMLNMKCLHDLSGNAMNALFAMLIGIS